MLFWKLGTRNLFTNIVESFTQQISVQRNPECGELTHSRAGTRSPKDLGPLWADGWGGLGIQQKVTTQNKVVWFFELNLT